MTISPFDLVGQPGHGPYPFATLLRSTDRDRLLTQLVKDVWDTGLNLPILQRDTEQHLDSTPSEGPLLSGSIRISGIWSGSVVMCVPFPLVRECAALMCGCPEAELTEAEVRDSWGELVNMVGGNLKALLPPPAQLGLPDVREVAEWRCPDHGATIINDITFACLGERMRLTVLKDAG